MFTAEQLPAAEAELRQEKCRRHLQSLAPEVSGMLIFSRTNIYYLTGTRSNGILWLPREGEPVLMVRKAPERCRLESPLQHIVSFKSYTHIPELCAQCGVPLTGKDGQNTVLGAEMRALPWSLAQMLQERLPSFSFCDTSAVFDRVRQEKTPYELQRLRHSATQHSLALQKYIPQRLHVGMSEQSIAHTLWDIFFELGHGGMLRQDRYNSDIFLGSIAIGENALYPTPFRSPVGSLGQHPAMPYMGYAGSLWKKEQSLIVDTGFMFEGYHSSAAATYFAGKKEEIPQDMTQAYAFCVQLMQKLQAQLAVGMDLSQLWHTARQKANTAGYANTFMGMGSNYTPILGSGVGLSMEEWPSIHEAERETKSLCPPHAVLTLSPMVALPHKGMVGLKAVFEIQEGGATCLTPYASEILCVE